MPYILQRRREKIDQQIADLASAIIQMTGPETDRTKLDGDLNYSITRLLSLVLDLVGSPKYHSFNAAVGVLECVKLELYRRKVAPYEDQKIEENGDV
jgi:hypothetical protein